MKHYVSEAVVCPFYIQEQAIKIHCEGFAKDNNIQVSFRNEEKKNVHRKKFCRSIQCYRECPLYKTIEKQYMEDN